ncbi:MAG: hypothetical protein ACYTHJ_02595 [Planctomycetota bacterium]|jgi:hypothetical protein
MLRTNATPAVIALCGLILAAGPVRAGVKLITLPPRERVDIQLDHPTRTLVQEERIVPLNAGENEIVFGFTGATIDVTSLQLRCLQPQAGVEVLFVSYPPNQAMVTWQVFAEKPVAARFRISYLIAGLSKTFSYRAVADRHEKTISLRQYMLLHNNANEAFGSAGMWAGFGERFERPIGINETKQLLSARFSEVHTSKTYTADLDTFGYLHTEEKQLRVPMHYVIRNDTEHGLGQFSLPPGKARIFQDDGRGTTAFLGEDWAGFTPMDDRSRLFLGQANDVVVKRVIKKVERSRVQGNLSNYHVIVEYEIENFKDQPITLTLVEHLSALRTETVAQKSTDVQWQFGDSDELGDLKIAEESTADKLVFEVPLPPRNEEQKATKITKHLHVILENEW